jgi:putative phosphoesterase
MLVGVVSDLHANLPALEAVLDDLPEVDAVCCAGDVVGYNPWPAECVDAMRERDVPTVVGNHDRMVVTGGNFYGNGMASAGVTYARNRLDDVQLAWLSGLPTECLLFDGRVKVVHGHPGDPDRYTYPHSFGPELLDDAPVLVMGHTHVQAHETYDEGIVMNPGSVGQPRDGDPRAAYSLLDLDRMTVDERRVAYDVERVREGIREAGLPERTGARLIEGR